MSSTIARVGATAKAPLARLRLVSSRPPERSRSPQGLTHWRPRGRIFLVIRLLGGRSGGAERLYCEMANMFADEGYEVTCLYCESGDEPPFYAISPKVRRVNLWGRLARKGPVYRTVDKLASKVSNGPLGASFEWLSKNLYFTRRLAAVMRADPPDVVISLLPPANTPTLIAGALTGASVVPTNHNVPEKDYRSPERWDQNPIDRFLRLWALYAAERVHVLFPTFAEWFPERIRRKTVVITNYVSADFEDVTETRPRRKEIVAVGRLAGVKNYMTLVEAWALLARDHPDWSVRIYGVGPQQQELQARIEELGLQDVVHLMGHESDIKTAYLEAEVLCHPALHEGFGLSVAEALACGLPVVAFSDCDGVNEFVHDGHNGLLVDRAGGVQALADGLRRLVEDDALRLRLRGRAPDSVRDFSREAFRESWTRLVDEIIDRRRRR